jgi:hypothetical protein
MLGGAVLVAAPRQPRRSRPDCLELVIVVGILAACGAGAIGPGLLMSAGSRWISGSQAHMANGIVNAGGSFGQFTVIPLAQLLHRHRRLAAGDGDPGRHRPARVPLILWIHPGPCRTCAAQPGGGRIAQAGRRYGGEGSQLPAAHRGILHLRLPRRLHRHAPAGQWSRAASCRPR